MTGTVYNVPPENRLSLFALLLVNKQTKKHKFCVNAESTFYYDTTGTLLYCTTSSSSLTVVLGECLFELGQQ